MMTERAPLVPDHVNLMHFAYMPLQVRQLRDSGIASCENAEEFRAAVLLWCAAWHQVPAASLPDDDRELAVLAGYGRFMGEWMRVREGALRGFVRCSDGRLYHPVIAERAMIAWGEHLRFGMRGAKGLAKRYGKTFDQGEWEGRIRDNDAHLEVLQTTTRAQLKIHKAERNGSKDLAQLELMPSPASEKASPGIVREGKVREGKGNLEAKALDQKHVRTPAAPARFADFWSLYPRNEAKKQAQAVWKSKGLDAKADVIIADVANRVTKHRAWLEGFVPHATTYLRNERWEDAIDERPSRTEPNAQVAKMGKRAQAYFDIRGRIDELQQREQQQDPDVVPARDRGGRELVPASGV